MSEPMEALVKIRYRGAKLAARLVPEGDGVRVEFAQAVQGGVSPGQAAVFYDEAGVVLGGGWMERRPVQPAAAPVAGGAGGR